MRDHGSRRGGDAVTPLARTIQLQKTLAHPVRLRFLAMLQEGPLCGCQISTVVKLAASTVSEHLGELRKSGLVVEEKDGRWVEYRLVANETSAPVVAMLVEQVQDDPAVRADAVLVKALRRVPLEELCSAGMDLRKLRRPALTSAMERAEKLRGTAGARR
jgi:ArsR family transcriptional regulator, arsenate/arsenite/antimonite-responsive transcriptional repressor